MEVQRIIAFIRNNQDDVIRVHKTKKGFILSRVWFEHGFRYHDTQLTDDEAVDLANAILGNVKLKNRIILMAKFKEK